MNPKFCPRLIPARALAGLLTVCCATAVQAQAHAQPQPGALSTDTLSYRSAFDGYQPFNVQALTPWVQSISTVGQIGGWRVYLKEAQAVQQAPVPQKIEATTPTMATPAIPLPRAAGGHAGHGVQP